MHESDYWYESELIRGETDSEHSLYEDVIGVILRMDGNYCDSVTEEFVVHERVWIVY